MGVVIKGVAALRHPPITARLYRQQLVVHLERFLVHRKRLGDEVGVPPHDAVVWLAEQVASVRRQNMPALVIVWLL